ncbi:MAG: dTDP-4-dehydrorhamnose 3,5-epimerase [Flavobacteriales bacterium]|nr:dTDP-4-dehydrorhamnose 3,5-epimerase [Flavobacteriales bacterium]
MTFTETDFKGLFVIEPRVFSDERGSFMETYTQKTFQEFVGEVNFVQDNESVSRKGVLRGLHVQLPPFGQGKLVRAVQGSVLDIAVDLRRLEPTFGKHFALKLSAENRLQMYIPAGFAHGFLSLEDQTVFSYKCTHFYSRDHERCIIWNDPHIGIEWGSNEVALSAKDSQAMSFAEFNSPF